MTRLRTGIIGMGQQGRHLLAALTRSDAYDVHAIGDRSRERAEELALQCDARAYDDYRSLIVQEDIEVLYLALPTFLCGECLNLAAKKSLAVFKEAPLGRRLPEALEWVKLLAKANAPFAIGADWRFTPGYRTACDWIQQGRLGQAYLAEGHCFVHRRDPLDWRGDQVLSGGGTLLEQGYHLVDLILANMGTPSTVYCLHTDWANKRLLPPGRTEDTAVVLIRFPNGAMARLSCAWRHGPQHEQLCYHGTEGTIEATPGSVTLRDPAGDIVDQQQFTATPHDIRTTEVDHFADSLRDAEVKPVSRARDHLATVAVIESAYLSTRTKLPEGLQVYGPIEF